MHDIMIFQRVESKYVIDLQQKEKLLSLLLPHLVPDIHGVSTISSLYMDTPDFRLVRASMDGKIYKEKLRLRSYGVPSLSDRVFLEIKKKYRGVVYKRRESMMLSEAKEYLQGKRSATPSQIMREIDYAFSYYKELSPSMQISYEREAYTMKEDPQVRITFDHGIRYRTQELFLENGNYGKRILGEDLYVMEIKTLGGMPVFLSHLLDELKIYPGSFSKYKNSFFDGQTAKQVKILIGEV